jgi:major membrane immunogen (membrane-anchored lipoprotein)
MSTRILSFFLFAGLLLVSACKDDDPEVTATVNGRWQGDESDIKVTYGVVTLYQEHDAEFDAALDFKDDGTITVTRDDGTTTEGTYQLNGNQLTTDVDFQFEGIDISSITFDIIELTETRLRLHMDQDYPVVLPEVGLVTTTIVGDFSFDRL